MSGTRGATAVDVRIAGVLLWLRQGRNSNFRDVSRKERRDLLEAGFGAPSGEAPPPRSPPESNPHRRRQVLAVGRRSRSGAVVAAHLPEPVQSASVQQWASAVTRALERSDDDRSAMQAYARTMYSWANVLHADLVDYLYTLSS